MPPRRPSGRSRRCPPNVYERRLVKRSLAGDGAAFGELVAPHQVMLQRFAQRFTHDRSLAEDVAQEALLAAWSRLATYEHRACFSTWLCTIAYHEALKVIRRREHEIPCADVPDIAIAGAESMALDRVSLDAALATLSPVLAMAFALRELAGLSYAEIADRESIPVQTVKSRLSRARANLAHALGGTSAQPA